MIQALIKIQKDLKVPKNQYNNFGGYKYRSCEDIVEAVKPLLHAEGLLMTISDTMVNVGDKNYIKATVTVTDGDQEVKTEGWAREAVERKGMDDSQITGSTSSYARKYALNGMFAIDDTKDADDLNTHGKKDSMIQLIRRNYKNNKETIDNFLKENDVEKPQELPLEKVKELKLKLEGK